MQPHNSASPAEFAADRHVPAALLRQYLSGELPASQQHAIEAHTLDCPTCADILAGLEATDAATTERVLGELHQRLQARLAAGTSQEPLGGVWRQAAAVAAVLLVTSGLAFWLRPQPTPEKESTHQTPIVTKPSATSSTHGPKSGELAASDSPLAAAPVNGGTPVEPSVSSSKAADPESQANPVAASSSSSPASAAVKKAPRSSVGPAKSPRAVASKPNSALSPPMSVDSGASKPTPPAPVQAPVSAGQPAASVAASKVVTRRVGGQLLDVRTGKPMAGVTIRATGTGIRQTTAADGKFSLQVPDSVRQLAFSAPGYRDTERALGQDSSYSISMTPLTSATQRTVETEGRGRETRMPAMPNIGPMPSGGYSAFNQYVQRELKVPEKDPPITTLAMKAIVKLRFIVAADGSLQDIKVVESLCDECDDEAIRVLKEGPAWFPAVVNGQRIAHKAQVTIVFQKKEK